MRVRRCYDWFGLFITGSAARLRTHGRARCSRRCPQTSRPLLELGERQRACGSRHAPRTTAHPPRLRLVDARGAWREWTIPCCEAACNIRARCSIQPMGHDKPMGHGGPAAYSAAGSPQPDSRASSCSLSVDVRRPVAPALPLDSLFDGSAASQTLHRGPATRTGQSSTAERTRGHAAKYGIEVPPGGRRRHLERARVHWRWLSATQFAIHIFETVEN